MSLKERLADFAGSISLAATDAPDDYAEWSSWTYESHMADLKELWAEIHPQLKRDLAQAEFIDGKLQDMFEAFNAGDKAKGRKAAWEIYNLDMKKMK